MTYMLSVYISPLALFVFSTKDKNLPRGWKFLLYLFELISFQMNSMSLDHDVLAAQNDSVALYTSAFLRYILRKDKSQETRKNLL